MEKVGENLDQPRGLLGGRERLERKGAAGEPV
jgi:hypothetical protein